MKTCKKCEIEKPVDQFRKGRNVCKPCRNAGERRLYNNRTEDQAEAHRERSRKWRSRNPAKRAAQVAKYKAVKSKRTPQWSDLDAIAAIYQECARVSKETGVPHHVDHILPLRGELVSGLHVPANLQILPAEDNMSKGNRWQI